jgi:hypothetical protein
MLKACLRGRAFREGVTRLGRLAVAERVEAV